MLQHELRPYDQLLAATIVQAASDFCEAYIAGLIDADNTVDTEALQRLAKANRHKRWRFPTWMHAHDISTAARLLFAGDTLDELLPGDWNIGADAIRHAVLRKAQAGERVSNYFVYESK